MHKTARVTKQYGEEMYKTNKQRAGHTYVIVNETKEKGKNTYGGYELTSKKNSGNKTLIYGADKYNPKVKSYISRTYERYGIGSFYQKQFHNYKLSKEDYKSLVDRHNKKYKNKKVKLHKKSSESALRRQSKLYNTCI